MQISGVSVETVQWFLKKLKIDLPFLLLFSRPVVSDSSRPHGLQHARPPCPSPSPRVCPSSCSFHQWCLPAISSSDALLSFCPQCFPASGTYPMSHMFASDNQNIGASASASVLPVNIQGWSPLRLTGLISLLSKRPSGVFSSTTVQRHQFCGVLPSLQSSSHNCMWPLGKPQPWLYGPLSYTIWSSKFSFECLFKENTNTNLKRYLHSYSLQHCWH